MFLGVSGEKYKYYCGCKEIYHLIDVSSEKFDIRNNQYDFVFSLAEEREEFTVFDVLIRYGDTLRSGYKIYIMADAWDYFVQAMDILSNSSNVVFGNRLSDLMKLFFHSDVLYFSCASGSFNFLDVPFLLETDEIHNLHYVSTIEQESLFEDLYEFNQSFKSYCGESCSVLGSFGFSRLSFTGCFYGSGDLCLS